MKNQDELIRIREEISARMKALDGAIWKESAGELHLQYFEMPNWILLYLDSDIVYAHEAFANIISEEMKNAEGIEATVIYYLIENGKIYHLTELLSTEEILKAELIDLRIDLGESQPLDQNMVFLAKDSLRE